MQRASKLKESVLRFFATPATAQPLAILRISLASILLLQAFLLLPALHDLYGEDGIIQSGLSAYLSHPFAIGAHEISNWVKPFGVSPSQTLELLFLGYVLSLSSLLIGWHTRVSAVGTYFFHSVLMYHSGFLSSYGVDTYAHIVLFYFVFFPIQRAYSLDLKLGRTTDVPSSYNRLALRLLQGHLAVSYCASGIAKSMGEQWWDGEIIWRALTVPEFSQFNVAWLAFIPWLPKFLSLSTLVVEIGYPVFAFLPWTRKFLVAAMVCLHAGIFLGLGLHTFSLLMIALNVSLFGVSPEVKEKTKLPSVSHEPAVDLLVANA